MGGGFAWAATDRMGGGCACRLYKVYILEVIGLPRPLEL